MGHLGAQCRGNISAMWRRHSIWWVILKHSTGSCQRGLDLAGQLVEYRKMACWDSGIRVVTKTETRGITMHIRVIIAYAN